LLIKLIKINFFIDQSQCLKPNRFLTSQTIILNVPRMKKTIFFLALTCIFMASCNEELFTEDIDSQSKINLLEKSDPYLNGKAVTKTFKIQKWAGTIEFDFDNDKIILEGTGIASFLGKFVSLGIYEEIGVPESMTGKIWGANGDRIDLIYDFKFNPPVIQDGDNAICYYKIVGGTGRFAGATGTIVMHGYLSIDTGNYDMQGEGEITF